jgi:tRNA (mo5U34)-methyltransferase
MRRYSIRVVARARSDEELANRVASVRWYHSVPLPNDIITPGHFDTVGELRKLPFPASLDGLRCLDVATSDGFWAFEMERRGAAEVLAIDVHPKNLDWPGSSASHATAGARGWPEPRGFEVAHDALQSSVQWRELSVYDLDPSLVGEFDFVFMGSVLCHLRDPVAALAAIGGVLRGELLSVDAISAPLTLLHPRQAVAGFEAPGWPLWWVPNLTAYRHLFGAASLDVLASGRPFFLRRRPQYSATYGVDTRSEDRRSHARLKSALSTRLGNLHAWVRATRSLQ